jgi:hypothetical protein
MPQLKPEDIQRIVTFYAPEQVTALAFSPDGKMLAVATADKVHLFQIPPVLATPNEPK